MSRLRPCGVLLKHTHFRVRSLRTAFSRIYLHPDSSDDGHAPYSYETKTMIDARFQTAPSYSLPVEICTSCTTPALPGQAGRLRAGGLTVWLFRENLMDWKCCSCCATSRSLLDRPKKRENVFLRAITRSWRNTFKFVAA